jgi:type I restriction enzyme, S subunit
MSELPSSWAWSTIGELTTYIQRGKSPKYTDHSTLPIINQKCIRWNQLELEHLKFIHPDQFDAWDQARFITPGDILWNSTGTGTVGRVYLVAPQDCLPPKVVDTHVTIVRSAPSIDHRYLFNWIKGPAVQDRIVEMCDGTTNQIELSRTAIAETRVPVAPALEQLRIADQLDTLLARANACNDRFDAIPALLKRFRQAVLNAAVSGELSTELAADTEQKGVDTRFGFPVAHIVDVLAEPLRNGKSVRDGDGLRVLRLTALKSRGVDLNENKRGDWTAIADTARFLVHDGDYLVSRGNGSKDLVGRGALVSGCVEPIAFPDTMIRFRPNPLRLLPQYLRHVWASEGVRLQIALAAKTTAGIWKVSQSDLESIRVPLPSLEEQAEIVRRVERLFALADRIEARCTAARTHAQRLAPQLLAKAFRGELVPQDPSDEPASVLLARIAAERAAPTTTGKTRQPRTPRAARAPKENAAMTKSRQDADVMGQPYLAAHLRRLGGQAPAEALFKAAELPVADFYKQLAWEVAHGHVRDGTTTLEAGDAP